jgi:hypothetical protein
MDDSYKDSIRKAIEGAQQQKDRLVVKLKELEGIQKEVARFDAFIERGQAILNAELELNRLSSTSTTPHVQLSEQPTSKTDVTKEPSLSQRVIELLKETGRPMRTSEIVSEFRKRNWKLSEKNGSEIMRFALRKKPELFSKDDQGRYFLKERIQDSSHVT